MELKKISSRFLLFVSILLLLSGCWSRRELNDLAVASAIGIDKHKDGYLLTAQIINPSQVAPLASSTPGTPVTIYQATGGTVFEALRQLTRKSSRKVYLSHLRIVVFSEEIAKEGLRNPLDFLSRDHELRTDFYIAVARKERAENVLKVLNAQERIPANAFFSLLEVTEEAFAAATEKKIDELISEIVSEGKDPVLTGMSIIGSINKGGHMDNLQKVDAPAKLKVNGTAVFRDDKLVGWLNGTETKGYII
ncbi:Ger(x)C family germination protein [Anoxybacillus vitaminiphilus]|uniref:Ger(X)C family germination protein n=1 Tax=Paranoxybacillus vitaminiphilus TaxID=581036 RepID=A0A327YMZ7_9BACL|nr:Ger(x)C family spore germination protein [Anoxybacillus vitaminiphilus]RAK22280.1 Ger(x)C family germination protein [Anoxybacillus vitaminiphilus]